MYGKNLCRFFFRSGLLEIHEKMGAFSPYREGTPSEIHKEN